MAKTFFKDEKDNLLLIPIQIKAHIEGCAIEIFRKLQMDSMLACNFKLTLALIRLELSGVCY